MWWTLKSMYLGPGATTAALNCTTSQDDHLYVAFAPWEPTRTALWRLFRGKDYLCGYKYTWDTPIIVEQQLPGDTEFHLFALTDLTPNTTYWGYMFAPDGHYSNEIQGPLFNFTTTGVAPGPVPTPDPLPIDIANPVFRCGNRYTFWANDTWYAHVPSIFSLTMWKLVEGVMIRQDHAHEPVAPAGLIRDADSRMDSLSTTIHCSYFCLVPRPGPNLLRYAMFDLTSDTWTFDEAICTPDRSVLATGETSLILDQNDIPHVVYTDYWGWYPEIDYRHRTTGVWSVPMRAIAVPNKLHAFPSLDFDPLGNVLACGAIMNTGEYYYNRYLPGDPNWGFSTQCGTGLYIPVHSLATGPFPSHIAQVRADTTISYFPAFDPPNRADNLTLPPSYYANIVCTDDLLPPLAIAFRDAFSHLAYVYRFPGEPWQPEVQLTPDTLIILTAHYAPPDTIACLYSKSLPIRCAFFAFYAPWH